MGSSHEAVDEFEIPLVQKANHGRYHIEGSRVYCYNGAVVIAVAVERNDLVDPVVGADVTFGRH